MSAFKTDHGFTPAILIIGALYHFDRLFATESDFQQVAIESVFVGKSLTTIAKEIIPSRNTISRWFNQLKEKFDTHSNVLRQHN